jgi:hypothetical protein
VPRVGRALTGLVVVAGLLVVGDRTVLTVAERTVGAELQAAAALDSRPAVRIHGFPFLTQAVAGTYREVEVEAERVPTQGLPLARLDVDLADVEVELGAALSGEVDSAPVRALTATALVSYADLARAARVPGLRVSRAGDGVAVSASLELLGTRVTATATSDVRLDGDEVVVTARELRVGADVASRELAAAIGTRLDLRARVGGLPYDLRLTGVSAADDGVLLTATARETVLSARERR